jgi:hypothetical protein
MWSARLQIVTAASSEPKEILCNQSRQLVIRLLLL